MIGRCGLIDGTWIDPVTAQLMITLPRLPSPGIIAHRGSGWTSYRAGAQPGACSPVYRESARRRISTVTFWPLPLPETPGRPGASSARPRGTEWCRSRRARGGEAPLGLEELAHRHFVLRPERDLPRVRRRRRRAGNTATRRRGATTSVDSAVGYRQPGGHAPRTCRNRKPRSSAALATFARKSCSIGTEPGRASRHTESRAPP